MAIKIKLDWKHSCWNKDGKSMFRSASAAENEFLSYFEDKSWYPADMNDSRYFDLTLHNGLLLDEFDLSKFEYVGYFKPDFEVDEFGSYLLFKKGTVYIKVKTYDDVDKSNERVKHLEAKISNQKHEIRKIKDCLEEKNKQLDAMHFVWCSGGCSGGVHRYKDMQDIELTEDIVKKAEANTRGLRAWFENKKSRDNKDGNLKLGFISKWVKKGFKKDA